MCMLTPLRLGLTFTSSLDFSLCLFTHFCLIDLLSVPLTLFHVLTSVLISPPLTAVVLLSVSQTGLSEYVHGLS